MFALGVTYRLAQRIVGAVETCPLHQHEPFVRRLLHDAAGNRRFVHPAGQGRCTEHRRNDTAEQGDAKKLSYGDARRHG